MDKSNLIGLVAVLLVAGFVVGRLDAKSRTAASAPAVAPLGEIEVAAAPAPSAPTPSPTVQPAAVAPSAARPKPAASSSLSAQTDEGAGKGADLDEIGHSPKVGAPFLGEKVPVAQLVIFSDFQCPVCRRSADPIKQLVLDFPGKVRVVFRNNALAMHGRAQPAAMAATAAKRQGKFWPYHDKLFHEGALDDASLRRFATEVGCDMSQFEKDLADPTLLAEVQRESKWAEAMGASGTPAFFVNGVRQVGWGSYLALKSMIGREIQKGDELIAQGTPKAKVIEERIKTSAATNTRDADDPPIDPAKWVEMLTAP